MGVNATLTKYKAEDDSDYHLVLSDAAGNTLIAEIPLPGCVGSGSPFLSKITSARAAFDAKFNPTSSFQTTSTPVQITGVGMFDFLHGQTGVAPNGIEIHPVLSIVFNPTSDFSISASPGAVSAAQGGSVNTTVSTAVSGGFNSAVSLSASGLPAGASATFTPTSIAAPGSGTSTLKLSAGTAAAGTYTVTVTGTGGGKTHSTTVSFTVTTTAGPDFALSVSPSSVSIAVREQRHRDGLHHRERRLQLRGRAVHLRRPHGCHGDVQPDVDRGARLRARRHSPSRPARRRRGPTT